MTLRELRKEQGLRQEDVAKLLEVDQAAVSQWETGKSGPSRKYRRKLAKLYGVPEDELTAEPRRKRK